jgi:diacylglycerol kinase (ATP)
VTEAGPSRPIGPTGLLINTRARLAPRAESFVLEALQDRGVDAGSIVRIKHPQGIGRAVDALLDRGVTRLIVGGGDGTSSTVASRLAHREVDLGVIPLGTANDFARTLGIPTDLAGAIEVVASGKVHFVDLAWANDAYFLNVASVGMSVSVSATAELSPARKLWFGSLAYAHAGLRALAHHPQILQPGEYDIRTGLPHPPDMLGQFLIPDGPVSVKITNTATVNQTSTVFATDVYLIRAVYPTTGA